MIRKAIDDDINIINELGNIFNNNFIKTYNLKRYIEDNKYIILVNDDKKVNAFLIAYNNVDYIELEAIFVDELNRKKGIGNNLLANLINYSELQKKDILLEVASNNIIAINLYKKHKFQIINTRKAYYNNCIDAYLMKRVV